MRETDGFPPSFQLVRRVSASVSLSDFSRVFMPEACAARFGARHTGHLGWARGLLTTPWQPHGIGALGA